MKLVLLAATAIVGLAASAAAAPVITFGQTSNTNTITASSNAAGTSFSDTGIAISISQIAAPLATPLPAFLKISAASDAPGATTVGGALVEHFDGAFAVTANANGSGTNYLSGVFNDAAITSTGSTSIGVFASTAAFTSDVVTALSLPRSLSLALTNVTPPVSLAACGGCGSGQTIAAFDASIAGNASANAVAEPGSLALLGVGLLGLAGITQLRRRH